MKEVISKESRAKISDISKISDETLFKKCDLLVLYQILNFGTYSLFVFAISLSSLRMLTYSFWLRICANEEIICFSFSGSK